MNSAIIDAHAHAFPDKVAARAMDALVPEAEAQGYFAYRDGTLGSLQRVMDQAGVAAAVICSIATKPEQAGPILAWSRQIASERFWPLASIHPDSPTWQAELAAVRDAGLAGIKLHPMYQRFCVDEPRMTPIYRAAAEMNLVICFHSGYDLAFGDDDNATPRRLAAVLDRVPALKLVLTHTGAWHAWDEVLDVLAGRDVWFETSMSFGDIAPELFAMILEKHPADRLMWGTDTPWADVAADLAAARAAVPPERHAAFFHDTAARLFWRVAG
jgi:predicted TIM-barrel fold metal-dependent hydrolase